MIRIATLAALVAPATAVTLLQTEGFDDPTQWQAGTPHPSPPTILPDSGPLGSGDPSLRITANGGSGAGSKLVVLNTADWTGDYGAIPALRMDLRNLTLGDPSSLPDFTIRLALSGEGGWFVTGGHTVEPGRPWGSYEFSLLPGDLQPAGGSDPAATLATVSEVRILHSNGGSSFRGEVISGTLLVDNITAIPETGSALLLLASVTMLTYRKR